MVGMRHIAGAVLTSVCLAACAPQLQTYPAVLRPPGQAPERYVLRTAATGTSTAGFKRTLPAGTAFVDAGVTPWGTALRPIDMVLTAEGANIAQADAVVADSNWVGFYLRVEHSFSPLLEPVPINLEKQP
jgi:hypothetical protein